MKRLLIFTIWQDDDEVDLTPESGLWYLRRYECYFDEVCHLCLLGQRTEKLVQNGNSKYVTVGTGNNKLDLLLAPFRLYKFAADFKPHSYLAVEQVWLFWVVPLVKLLLRAKIYLLPITYPEAMYKLTGRSLTGRLPIWLERLFISVSYWSADSAITSENLGSYKNWMLSNSILGPKLIIAKSIPESIPTRGFFDALAEAELKRESRSPDEEIKLIYVGRLHAEKSVDDLVRMMDLLKRRNVRVHLTVIGDGAQRQMLQDLARTLDVADRIDFLGWKPNSDLPDLLVRSDIFVSPSTGGSLREAALCGLPVIAYEMDWIEGLLKDRETYLAVTPNDWTELADKVELLVEDRALRLRLADSLRVLGRQLWSEESVEDSIRQVFDVS